MNCLVCNTRTDPFFTKDFQGDYGLAEIRYRRCSGCGCVFSETHAAMSRDAWEDLNERVHAEYQGGDHAAADPRWLERLAAQDENIARMAGLGLLPRDLPWLDYACGDGKLADMLVARGLPVRKYDRYMHGDRPDYLGEAQLRATRYANVISTSFFEHVLSLEPLDEVAGLVDEDGVLSLHTLVRGAMPRDPAWFYLVPVHVAFFTNRGMALLCERWGFTASIYHVPSRMWFLYKRWGDERDRLARAGLDLDGDDDFCQRGFVAYWTD